MSKVLPKKNPLPSKEQGLFKELLTLYETRQIKKGLKVADQILKKFPDHGETLCMKGLVLTHMSKHDEGLDLVKKGVRLDLTSHICWHVFGLVQKADKHYEEALKSYTQALRFDKDNMNLLRDSAQLQTQLGLYEALVDTRHAILRLRPNLRQNWVALAVAHNLNGNHKEAKMVLEHYQRSLKNVPDYDIEHSETLLYYIHILEQVGEFSEALSVLDSNSKSRSIVDRLAVLEIRARILTKLKAPEADEAWQALIQHNPDNYESYHAYFDYLAISLEIENPEAVAKLEDFAKQLPRATAPRRLQLTASPSDQSTFAALVKPYLIKNLTKGIPSLFADIKSLYSNPTKRDIIQSIAEGLLTEYASSGAPSSNAGVEAEPTTYLWTLYFLAQHYSYLGQHTKALTLLDTAIEHTPTLPELYMCKARTLKRAGDLLGAARCQNDARLLDGQDRFLNTKFGKYLLRAGMVDEANAIFGLFTKKDAVSPAADLEDMQSLLFLTEEADAYRCNKKLNLALKKYIAIKKVFDEIEDDQFDFHGYNLRKFTINIYLNLLSWESRLRSHPVYAKAAIEASKIFVAVYDNPSLVSTMSSANQLTDAEKKARKKAAKKAAAAQKVQEEKKGANPATDKDPEDQKPKDDDPDGMKLLGSDDPLEQAASLLAPLRTLKQDSVEMWVVLYDVAIRRKKLLQAVHALTRATSLSAAHPEVHLRLVDLRLRASALPQVPPAPIGDVFMETVNKLVPQGKEGDTLKMMNTQYLQQHTRDARVVLACARVVRRLEGAHTVEVLGEVESMLFGVLSGNDVELSVQVALESLDLLSSLSSTRAEEFRTQCQVRFPLSTVFKTPAELAPLREQVMLGSLAAGELHEKEEAQGVDDSAVDGQ